jgi:hypothetical protein
MRLENSNRLCAALIGVVFAAVSPSRLPAQNAALDRTKAESEQNEALRRAREDELANSRRLVRDFRSRIGQASDLLAQLQKEADGFDKRFESLLTSDDGKRIANDSEDKKSAAFLHYIDLQKSPPVRSAEVAEKKEFVDDLGKEMDKELARENVGYVPPTERKDEVEQMIAWAKAHEGNLLAEKSWLDHAISLSKKADLAKDKPLDLAKLKSLQAVIDDYHAFLIDAASQARLAAVKGLEEDVKRIAAEGARDEVTERARANADKDKRAAEAQIATMRVDFDNQLKRQKEADDQKIADLERQLAEQRAVREKQEAETSVIARKGQLDAAEIRHRQMIHDPEVQRLLGPFLARGYWQPGDGHDSYGRLVPSSIDATPMSLKRIRAAGALNRTRDGLAILYDIGERTHGNQDRDVKWGFGRFEDMSPAELEQLKLAQKYLDEMGEALVAEKMLEP